MLKNNKESAVLTPAPPVAAMPLDSLLGALSPVQLGDIYSQARALTSNRVAELEFRALTMGDEKERYAATKLN